MIKRETQVITVILVVLALGLIHVGHQVSVLGERIREIEKVVGPITVGVTINYGNENFRTETVRMMLGATALDALEKIATVEKTWYPALGTYSIDAIDGIRKDPEAGKYWMWYIWENEAWTLAPVGSGKYVLKDGDNIKFSYEIPVW